MVTHSLISKFLVCPQINGRVNKKKSEVCRNISTVTECGRNGNVSGSRNGSWFSWSHDPIFLLLLFCFHHHSELPLCWTELQWPVRINVTRIRLILSIYTQWTRVCSNKPEALREGMAPSGLTGMKCWWGRRATRWNILFRRQWDAWISRPWTHPLLSKSINNLYSHLSLSLSHTHTHFACYAPTWPTICLLPFICNLFLTITLHVFNAVSARQTNINVDYARCGMRRKACVIRCQIIESSNCDEVGTISKREGGMNLLPTSTRIRQFVCFVLNFFQNPQNLLV